MIKSPTERFSDRVDAYIRYRPGYPQALVSTLEDECGLTPHSVVADIGSGPGNLTVMLLPLAKRVYGIEPNAPMREAGERLLESHANFISVDGTAENTGLADSSVDLIVAAQAFHWFDRRAAKREFRRILRPGSFVALIWNDRQTTSTPFLAEYEALLQRYSSEYGQVNHKDVGRAEIEQFFEAKEVGYRTMPNAQYFDLHALRGRVLSSSYIPLDGEAHDRLMAGVDELFEKYQEDGTVAFLYDTQIFYGRLSGI